MCLSLFSWRLYWVSNDHLHHTKTENCQLDEPDIFTSGRRMALSCCNANWPVGHVPVSSNCDRVQGTDSQPVPTTHQHERISAAATFRALLQLLSLPFTAGKPIWFRQTRETKTGNNLPSPHILPIPSTQPETRATHSRVSGLCTQQASRVSSI